MIDTRLSGQNVLVTGGAGNIGAAISRAFAAQGARVAIHYLAQDRPAPQGVEQAHITPDAHAAAVLARELGNGAFTVSADLSEPDAAARLADAVTGQAGRSTFWSTTRRTVRRRTMSTRSPTVRWSGIIRSTPSPRHS